jgi:hypothetical protein
MAPAGTKELSFQEQGLIMHYLIQAKGAPITETWITFREIPSGEFYYSAFVKRAKEPLVKTFGDQPDLLVELGFKMGGTRGKEGDASLYFKAFPPSRSAGALLAMRISPDGNVLDASISNICRPKTCRPLGDSCLSSSEWLIISERVILI